MLYFAHEFIIMNCACAIEACFAHGWCSSQQALCLQLMNGEAAAELRLEPGGFGWHNVAAVGDIHQLLH